MSRSGCRSPDVRRLRIARLSYDGDIITSGTGQTERIPVVQLRNPKGEPTSQNILSGEIANELVFAVVGHVGSGTTQTAKLLKAALEGDLPGGPYDVTHLKAREAILSWAEKRGKPLPKHEPKNIEYVTALQNLGDEMRETGDHAAVARAMIRRVREVRASKQGKSVADGEPVTPDGQRRAYILDSIRHPSEIQLLRTLYQAAFTLVGVVCDEETRVDRLTLRFSNAGVEAARALMKRDAEAPQKHGQRVADAFHMADVFLDNSAAMFVDGKSAKPNREWDIPDQLNRLVRIILHSEIVRPRPEETAMHAAYGAQVRSACLSRQVGAALIDEHGNVVATGTNDVPRGGGGLYQGASDSAEDHRCAYRHVGGEPPYCSNTREQKEIIREAVQQLIGSGALRPDQADAASDELQRTRIGALLEFSRAVHAEMDALLSAARTGKSTTRTRLFVTTFPCHYCARHVVAAGIEEVQYIEPYPKSQALKLHDDSISVDPAGWKPFSQGGTRVLFRPFRGIAPRMYARAFLKDRDLKDRASGNLLIAAPEWGSTWDVGRISYVQLEAKLSKDGE